MMSQGFEDEGEVHIREIVFGSQSQVYDPIPSQWTLSQRDDRSPPFPLPRRKERIQHERIGFNSPQSESDNSLSHENDFANLEALLEDQQKVSATCIKNDASIAEKDDKPVGSTAKSPNVDPEEDTALACPAHLRSTSNDDVADNNLTDVSGLMEHLPKRQSTFRLRAETGICEPSRSNAYANRSGVVDPTSRRLPCKLPTAMVSSLLDSTSLNHSSILEKSRKMAAQSMKQRPTRIFKEGRSNSMLASIAGPRPTHWDQRDLAISNKRRSKSLDTNTKRSRAAVLSAFAQVGEGRLPSSRKQVATPARQQVPNLAVVQCQDPIVDDLEHEKPKEATRISFATNFISLPSSPVPHSNMDLASSRLPSPQMTPSMGSRGKKSKALFSGRLCKRLQSLRDTVRGDKIRFQSGQYPFSVASLDMNDPRNRATSELDVTLLETSGMSNRESQKVLMLGFVHHATGGLSHLMSQFSWICFACDTARELTLQNGSQLRIYNAVSMELSGPLCCSPSSQYPTIKWTILATTLCEPYPTELPQLPDAPAILSGQRKTL